MDQSATSQTDTSPVNAEPAAELLTPSQHRCTRPACPEKVPLEYMHLGMGLCAEHQYQYDHNFEVIFRGRKRLFYTPVDMWTRAVAYFEKSELDKKPLTTSGLVLALGCSWQGFLKYRNGVHGPGFSQVAWEILQTIERFAESNLYGEHKQGARFHLMAKFGYAERTETITGSGGAAAPLVYLPHNGRDPVETLAPDPARTDDPAVSGDVLTKSSDRQSPPEGAPQPAQ